MSMKPSLSWNRLARLDPAGLLVPRDQLALGLARCTGCSAWGTGCPRARSPRCPARSYSTSVRTTLPSPPKPLSTSAIDRQLGRAVDRAPRPSRRLGHRRQVEVRQRVGHRGDPEAADPDRVEAVRADRAWRSGRRARRRRRPARGSLRPARSAARLPVGPVDAVMLDRRWRDSMTVSSPGSGSTRRRCATTSRPISRCASMVERADVGGEDDIRQAPRAAKPCPRPR